MPSPRATSTPSESCSIKTPSGMCRAAAHSRVTTAAWTRSLVPSPRRPATGGTFRIDLHDVVANDEHAVAIYVTRGEREGRTLEARQVLVSHIRNGKLTEAWLMSEDQYAADEFFS